MSDRITVAGCQADVEWDPYVPGDSEQPPEGGHWELAGAWEVVDAQALVDELMLADELAAFTLALLSSPTPVDWFFSEGTLMELHPASARVFSATFSERISEALGGSMSSR